MRSGVAAPRRSGRCCTARRAARRPCQQPVGGGAPHAPTNAAQTETADWSPAAASAEKARAAPNRPKRCGPVICAMRRRPTLPGVPRHRAPSSSGGTRASGSSAWRTHRPPASHEGADRQAFVGARGLPFVMRLRAVGQCCARAPDRRWRYMKTATSASRPPAPDDRDGNGETVVGDDADGASTWRGAALARSFGLAVRRATPTPFAGFGAACRRHQRLRSGADRHSAILATSRMVGAGARRHVGRSGGGGGWPGFPSAVLFDRAAEQAGNVVFLQQQVKAMHGRIEIVMPACSMPVGAADAEFAGGRRPGSAAA